jgi:hypothetical protein
VRVDDKRAVQGLDPRIWSLSPKRTAEDELRFELREVWDEMRVAMSRSKILSPDAG